MALSKVNPNLITQGASGRKNLIINGAMQVAQRGTSLTGLYNNTNYLIDRFSFGGGATDGRVTMSQDSDGPAGFANSLKLACTTADTSIAATEENYFQYRVEGQDLQQLKKGTSSAESMTLSFYVKGNAAATYTAEFYDADNQRHNGQTFSVTTSWNKVTLTYVPDTTGAYNDDNALSLYLFIWIHAGSEFTSGTFTSNTWLSNDATRRIADQTSFYDSTSRTLNITGVQLEVGAVATNFEHRSYGEEIKLCERYYQKLTGSYAAYGQIANMNYNSAAQAQSAVVYRTEMRAAPSLSYTSTSSNNSSSAYAIANGSSNSGAVDYIDTLLLYNPNTISTLLYTGNSAGGTAREAGNLYVNSTITELALVAEL